MGTTKKYYRVDRRDIAENEEVSPEGDYQSGFDDVGKEAEKILEKIRKAEFQNKPPRASSLFVTDDLPRYSSTVQGAGKRPG